MRRDLLSVRILVNTVIAVLLILISGTSCSMKGYKKLENKDELNVSKLHIFGEEFKLAKYRSNFRFYSKNLSGITLIKKLDNSYRVVAMSELGMKYFDIEFPFDENKQETVHYIMEPMNKKLVIKMLVRDLGMLFYLPEVVTSKVRINENNNSGFTYKNNGMNYLFDKSRQVYEIVKDKRPISFKKIVSITDVANEIPDNLTITHGKVNYYFEAIYQ